MSTCSHKMSKRQVYISSKFSEEENDRKESVRNKRCKRGDQDGTTSHTATLPLELPLQQTKNTTKQARPAILWASSLSLHQMSSLGPL